MASALLFLSFVNVEEEGSAFILGSLVEINVGEVLYIENAHTYYTHIYVVVRFIEFCLCDNYLVPWLIFSTRFTQSKSATSDLHFY